MEFSGKYATVNELYPVQTAHWIIIVNQDPAGWAKRL